MSCDTGAIAKCTHPTGHKPVLQPQQHAALESPLKTAGSVLQSIGGACACDHPHCWARVARVGLAAMEAAAGSMPGRMTAVVTYDPELLEVGRVAALRTKRANASGTVAARRAVAADYAALADAFEEISRALPQGE